MEQHLCISQIGQHSCKRNCLQNLVLPKQLTQWRGICKFMFLVEVLPISLFTKKFWSVNCSWKILCYTVITLIVHTVHIHNWGIHILLLKVKLFVVHVYVLRIASIGNKYCVSLGVFSKPTAQCIWYSELSGTLFARFVYQRTRRMLCLHVYVHISVYNRKRSVSWACTHMRSGDLLNAVLYWMWIESQTGHRMGIKSLMNTWWEEVASNNLSVHVPWVRGVCININRVQVSVYVHVWGLHEHVCNKGVCISS